MAFEGFECDVLKSAFGKLAHFFRTGRWDQREEEVERLLLKLPGKKFDSQQFERTIGYRPKHSALFIQSLLHRSYLQFVEGEWSSNERLEFLGDAILNCLVAIYLYKTFPSMEEGDLTKLRSRLVNRKVLSQRAKELNLPDFLLLSASAAQSLDSGSESILADAFEAIIGAIFMDGGFGPAREFVHRTLLSNVDVLNTARLDDNYKSALLEYSQGKALGVPRYTIVREEGPDHDRRFTVEVFLGSESFGVGTGRSKKDAEQVAAYHALEKIQRSQSVADM